MADPRAAQERQGFSFSGFFGAGLFLAVFAYYWITITPFIDLTGAGVVDPQAGNSNTLNQLATLAIFAALGLFLWVGARRVELLGSAGLMGAILFWCVLTSALAVHPDLAIKRTVLVAIMCFNAAVFLLLPRSGRQFAELSGVVVLAVLALCYYGVLFRPQLSIHQPQEILEPMNAGYWRGLFPHKNVAAGAMVISVFLGLYIMAVRSRALGLLICALAVFFLSNTGGKTSMMVLPATLVMAFMIERYPVLRFPVVVGGLAGFNIVAVGSAVFEPLHNLVRSLGVDPTFTNRADIWRFAFDAIVERPVFGYGLASFWQTEGLVYSGSTVETWAAAAYNGHNGYIDAVIGLGVPGLVLTLIWLVFIPMRDIGRAQRSGNDPALTTLYVRIWLYALFTACIESVFFQGGGALWFCLLISVFGLSLQARARLVSEAAPAPRPVPEGTYSHA